jgi:hypothetical protein
MVTVSRCVRHIAVVCLWVQKSQGSTAHHPGSWVPDVDRSVVDQWAVAIVQGRVPTIGIRRQFVTVSEVRVRRHAALLDSAQENDLTGNNLGLQPDLAAVGIIPAAGLEPSGDMYAAAFVQMVAAAVLTFDMWM